MYFAFSVPGAIYLAFFVPGTNSLLQEQLTSHFLFLEHSNLLLFFCSWNTAIYFAFFVPGTSKLFQEQFTSLFLFLEQVYCSKSNVLRFFVPRTNSLFQEQCTSLFLFLEQISCSRSNWLPFLFQEQFTSLFCSWKTFFVPGAIGFPFVFQEQFTSLFVPGTHSLFQEQFQEQIWVVSPSSQHQICSRNKLIISLITLQVFQEHLSSIFEALLLAQNYHVLKSSKCTKFSATQPIFIQIL